LWWWVATVVTNTSLTPLVSVSPGGLLMTFVAFDWYAMTVPSSVMDGFVLPPFPAVTRDDANAVKSNRKMSFTPFKSLGSMFDALDWYATNMLPPLPTVVSDGFELRWRSPAA
jgi:hypothetical protein